MTRKTTLLLAAAAEIRAFCIENANQAQAKRYERFFNEGYDAYGIPKDVWEANRTRFFEKFGERFGLEGLLDLGDLLFESGKYEEGSFAIVTIMPLLDQFTPEAFQRVGLWLQCGVRNWAHADVICREVLSPCLKNRLIPFSGLSAWRQSDSKWKRRAVPVSLLVLLEGAAKIPSLLKFIEPLMLDSERVVHQGTGWFLREAWKKDPALVEEMLLKWKETAPRLIYQYATEKMTPAQKQRYRKSKQAGTGSDHGK
jgi:3-methyladenine DNA glycosylase AlkD